MTKKKIFNINISDLYGEIWKDIKHYEGWYQVSNKERVKSLQREIIFSSGSVRLQNSKLLKPRIANGYLGVTLTKNSMAKTISVHRLVAESFIPNPKNKPHVNHKDGNKLNNHLYNLEWSTSKENIQHSWANNLSSPRRGERCTWSILKDSDILEIREMGKSVTRKELAEKYGVSASFISRIILRKVWFHI